MSVDKATVRTIAHLARIRISEDDVAQVEQDLSQIVDWIAQLEEVKTDGVAPLDAITEGHALPWRADTVTDGGRPEAVLANAPEAEDGFFLVPKVVE